MAELNARTRFPIPLTSSRIVSNQSLSPTRRYKRLQSAADDVPYDISPESILQAFANEILPPPDAYEHKYLLCSRTASSSQTDLAIRVAKVAINARDWYSELESWSWPGTFERSIYEEAEEDGGPTSYVGSLPLALVENYECRIDEIQNELDALDVQELKNYIGEMHGSRSRPASRHQMERVELDLMDDFSLLITGTLVQSLPLLTLLNDILDMWSIRLSILQQAPKLLDGLEEQHRAMQLAWNAIAFPDESNTTLSTVNTWKHAVTTISGLLKKNLSDFGRKMDRMLDSLEGRNDTLPDAWIDDLEKLEEEYGLWEVEAQRRSLELDLRLLKLSAKIDNQLAVASPDDDVRSSIRSEPSHLDSTTVLDSNALSPNNAIRDAIDQKNVNEESTTNEQDAPRSISPEQLTSSVAESIASQSSEESFDGYNITRLPNVSTEGVDGMVADMDQSTSSLDSENSYEQHQIMAISDLSVSVRDDSAVSEHSGSLELPFDTVKSADAIPTGAMIPAVSKYKDEASPETPDHIITNFEESPTRTEVSTAIIQINSTSESPCVRLSRPSVDDDSERPPLNSAMSKRRPRHSSNTTQSSTSTSWLHAHDEHTVSRGQKGSPSKPTPGDLDEQISDILTTVPANIRLRRSADVDKPEARNPRPTSQASGSYSQRLRASRSLKTPELTLTAVRPEGPAAHRRSSGDQDIQLYHLIQPGLDKPIKLFIRTVGENGERVMVRVGGGWADLGEYLRQYAEHHGRRTVSEGKLEVLSPASDNTSPQTARGGSTSPSTPPKAREGANTTPSRSSIAIPSMGSPESALSSGTSKMSWKGEEVGLAGPTVKKLELSNEKKEWIDSMMSQARRISGNISTKGSGTTNPDREFADLGRVGGTKRVFFRAPSRQSLGRGGE